MNKNNIVLVITFCMLNSLATSTTANESIDAFLVYYGGGPELTAQDIPILAEYDLLVMGRQRFTQVNGNTWAAIKAVSPDTKIFLYQIGPFVADNTDTTPVVGLNNLGRYNVNRDSSLGSINKDYSNWFLKNSNGQRATLRDYPNYFLLDYGNSDFAAYWAKHTLEDIAFQKWGADGVFIDEVGLCTDWKLTQREHVPVKYSNCQSWNKNMNDYIARVSGSLHQHNQQVMASIGNSFSDAGLEPLIDLGQRNSAPDVMHTEGAFVVAWGDRGDVFFWNEQDWKQQIDLPAKVNRHIALMSHTDLSPGEKGVSQRGEPVSHSQIKRYAIGSYLLARNTNGPTTYFFFDDGRKHRDKVYSRIASTEIYEDFDIGVPVAKYGKLPDERFYSRKYTEGYVYVNPSNEKIVGIKAERGAEFSSEYENNARQVGADWYFDLNPHDAAILRAKTSTRANKPTTPPMPPTLQQ